MVELGLVQIPPTQLLGDGQFDTVHTVDGAVQIPPTQVFGDAQFAAEHSVDGVIQTPPTHVFGDAQFDDEQSAGGVTGGVVVAAQLVSVHVAHGSNTSYSVVQLHVDGEGGVTTAATLTPRTAYVLPELLLTVSFGRKFPDFEYV